MDSINRSLNTEAIDLRIQIEEGNLNRPLTAAEKHEIVNTQLARPVTTLDGPTGRIR